MVLINIAHDIMKCEGGCTKWRRLSSFLTELWEPLRNTKKRSFKVDTKYKILA